MKQKYYVSHVIQVEGKLIMCTRACMISFRQGRRRLLKSGPAMKQMIMCTRACMISFSLECTWPEALLKKRDISVEGLK